jgi:hypothetical protein
MWVGDGRRATKPKHVRPWPGRPPQRPSARRRRALSFAWNVTNSANHHSKPASGTAGTGREGALLRALSRDVSCFGARGSASVADDAASAALRKEVAVLGKTALLAVMRRPTVTAAMSVGVGMLAALAAAAPAHAAGRVPFTIEEQIDFGAGVFEFTATSPLCALRHVRRRRKGWRVPAVRPGAVGRGQPGDSHHLHLRRRKRHIRGTQACLPHLHRGRRDERRADADPRRHRRLRGHRRTRSRCRRLGRRDGHSRGLDHRASSSSGRKELRTGGGWPSCRPPHARLTESAARPALAPAFALLTL